MSNLSNRNDDIVMNLESPKGTEDIREKHLINKYISKVFSSVEDADGAAVLLERHLNKSSTRAKL